MFKEEQNTFTAVLYLPSNAGYHRQTVVRSMYFVIISEPVFCEPSHEDKEMDKAKALVTVFITFWCCLVCRGECHRPAGAWWGRWESLRTSLVGWLQYMICSWEAWVPLAAPLLAQASRFISLSLDLPL